MARIVELHDHGPLNLKTDEGPVAVCRCGLSADWPYCDGSHKKTRDEDGQLYAYHRNTPADALHREEVAEAPHADPRP